jgi:hypothetical protein
MNGQLNISLSSIKNIAIALLHRFHVIIFTVIVLGGMTIVIFILNGVIVASGDSNGYSSVSTNQTFDQATIKRIEDLKTSSQTDNQLNLSSGRTNPFVE